jgi:aerobic-type carbon monoxide dehydrogenase small subunit (CoxS/CutS family)
MIAFSINSKKVSVDVDTSTPLLWVIRDNLGLTGTKYGCGIAQCGCCTVHLDGTAIPSCVTPISHVAGRKVTTIEGLASGGELHPVQRAWIEAQVPQCGYCQSGQIMTAAAFLGKNPHPTPEQIDQAMAGNLCRCGTYQRIRRAVALAAASSRSVTKPS